MKVFLLKKYNKKSIGDIIEINSGIAVILIKEGIGRYVTTRDFLVKPKLGVSKAFRFSPSEK